MFGALVFGGVLHDVVARELTAGEERRMGIQCRKAWRPTTYATSQAASMSRRRHYFLAQISGSARRAMGANLGAITAASSVSRRTSANE